MGPPWPQTKRPSEKTEWEKGFPIPGKKKKRLGGLTNSVPRELLWERVKRVGQKFVRLGSKSKGGEGSEGKRVQQNCV